jgi:DUF4097 and DUF4098 domain-containing protein YvlB
MSSYPPPPPGGPGQPGQQQPGQPQPSYPSQYPPNSTAYNRAVWKAQRRAAKQQEQWTRQQMKMQRRMMRPRSVVGPLVLITIGVLFLLTQMGIVSWWATLDWYGHWWPMVLVGAGLVLLAEWALDQHAHQTGQPYRGRTLGGGVVVLLILLALAGAFSHGANYGWRWKDKSIGFFLPDLDMALGERHDFDDSLNAPIQNGSALFIRNPHGDVTVTGSSDDGQVHVSVHKEAFSRTDEGAQKKEEKLQPVFSNNDGSLTLDVANVEGGQADLTVQVPRTTMLTVRADHGDIDVEELHATVSATDNNGEITLSGIDGAASAHMNNENSNFSAHSINGPLSLDGHAGDISVSNVTGPVTLTGDFFGTTDLESINGTVIFKTSRTQFEAARLDGDLNIALDSDLEANQILGPVKLITRDRGVSLDSVQGGVDISNRNGDVSVTTTGPMGPISINDSKGSVDLGVPPSSAFDLNAQTRNGDVENDFGLKQQGSDSMPSLAGDVAGGGPPVKIYTSDGDITVRKATVAPLPPAPPARPRITSVPTPPPVPAQPKTLKRSSRVRVTTPGVSVDVQ